MQASRFGMVFVVSVLLTLLLVKNSVAECSFEYIWQPPSTTLRDCDPYMGPMNDIRIILECRVRRQTGVTDQFDIKWFRMNTTGAVEDLGPGEPVSRHGNEASSRYHDTAFVNQKYKRNFLGKYWCQVINTTPDPDQPLMKSNMFTLLAPEDYTLPTCELLDSFTQALDNTTCADLPAQSDKTTLPVPATITETLASQMTTTSQVLSTIIMVTNKNQHTTLPHASQTAAAPVTSVDTTTSAVVTSTLVRPPTNDQTPSVLAGAVSGGAAILLVMIVSTLVVILILKKKRTREKAGHSVNSYTGVCINIQDFDGHIQTGKTNLVLLSSATPETDRNITTIPLNPVYEEPVVTTRELKHNNRGNMNLEAHYSQIRKANTTEGEMKREMHHLSTTAEDSHDNPVYGLNLEDAVTGGIDSVYSLLEHSSDPNTHENTSEQQNSFLQDTPTESGHFSQHDVG